MTRWAVSFVGVVCLATSACSGAKPVLYPNPHFQSVGKDIAEQDIEACRHMAESAGAEEGGGNAGRVAGSTAAGAGIGAAAGAVGGAISGAAGHAHGNFQRGLQSVAPARGLYEFCQSLFAREGV
jgi:hypothetical protein